MTDTLGISRTFESKFESVSTTKDIKLKLETETEKCYSVQKIILESIVLPLFEEQLKKNDSKNSPDNASLDIDKSIDDKSDLFLSNDNKIDCRRLADDDLSVSLSKLEIDEKVHFSKINGEKTNNCHGNVGGIQKDDISICEVIPRGKECKTKSGTKPYDRDMFQNAHAYINYLPTLSSPTTSFSNNYNPGYRQTCNILKHEDGFSGGTVVIRSPFPTAPQVINLKHVSKINNSNNSFDPVLYTQSENLPIKMSLKKPIMAVTPCLEPSFDEILRCPSFLNSPRSIEQTQSGVDCNESILGDILPEEITDASCLGDSCSDKFFFGDSDLSEKSPDSPSCINSPQSLDNDDFNLNYFEGIAAASSCPGGNVSFLPLGDNTPPYDPLNDIIVEKDENGEFRLFVQNHDSRING